MSKRVQKGMAFKLEIVRLALQRCRISLTQFILTGTLLSLNRASCGLF